VVDQEEEKKEVRFSDRNIDKKVDYNIEKILDEAEL